MELGCGSGEDTRWLATEGRAVVCGDLKIPSYALDGGMFVQFDHARPFPFSCKFDVVVASLCLHYFAWEDTKEIIGEISDALVPNGLLICRLNSIEDRHYGATGYRSIEPGLYDVDGLKKRFFQEDEIYQLLAEGWHIQRVDHRVIDRYEKVKCVWEFGARRV
ncbi:MAG: class I SAM-dependent methyltransferase [Halioglobus sp.]|nr:class I SAM-dependent methyltransferase [Halioglobus sp.]